MRFTDNAKKILVDIKVHQFLNSRGLPTNLSSISRRTGIPKNDVSNTLQTLKRNKYVYLRRKGYGQYNIWFLTKKGLGTFNS